MENKQAFHCWEAFCDGASRGNPGPAAYGVLICDSAGQIVKEVNAFLGLNTNQVAEYEALIRALSELINCGAQEARVLTDSEFVTKQFSGEYKVRDERMKILLGRVRELQKKFHFLEVIHIRRSSHPNNVLADQLANKALDERKMTEI